MIMESFFCDSKIVDFHLIIEFVSCLYMFLLLNYEQLSDFEWNYSLHIWNCVNCFDRENCRKHNTPVNSSLGIMEY